MKDRYTAYYIFALLLFVTSAVSAHEIERTAEDITLPGYSEADLKFRIENMTSFIKVKYTRVVKSYLKTYMITARPKAEEILGRASMYFPTIEKLLKEKGLPEDLKYLAVAESALNPHAVSRAGATGLWQFMPETGANYGLEINATYDERKDVVKSTLAAIEYLVKQYDRFGKWELAIAAYNSGPGKVKRAIRRGRSKDFWRIKRYLPRETRAYVPAFIGAMYLFKYFDTHDLTPNLPNLEFQLTEEQLIHDLVTFDEIAKLTGIPYHIIEALNPSFSQGYIPESVRGHYLVLPRRVMIKVLDYIRFRNTGRLSLTANADLINSYYQQNYYVKSTYVAQPGDNLETLARMFNLSKYNLMMWNKLSSIYLAEGQELVVYYPKEIERLDRSAFVNLAANLSALPNVFPVVSGTGIKTFHKNPNDSACNYFYYKLKRRESLDDVAAKYKGITTAQLVHLNHFNDDNKPVKGDWIKVKKIK